MLITNSTRRVGSHSVDRSRAHQLDDRAFGRACQTLTREIWTGENSRLALASCELGDSVAWERARSPRLCLGSRTWSPLVLAIRSSFRVSGDIGERPGEVLDDGRYEVA